MRVLYILHSTIMGGATISFLNLITGMKERNVEVIVVIPKMDYALTEKLKRLNVEWLISPLVSSYLKRDCGTITRMAVYYLKLIPRLLKKEYQKYKSLRSLTIIVRNCCPDIIHTNTGVIHEGYVCAKKLRIPHVWHLREYQDLDFNWKICPSKRVFISSLRKSNVITITNHILHYFQLDNSPNAQTIYNGIMNRNEVCFDWPKDNNFLCASRISPEKGHETIIRAFATFYKKHPNYRLTILGFGNESYISYLKKLSQDLGCSQSIEWLGFQSNVQSYMRKAKALIVASRFEGFGRMTAEACFCGCIVIGKNTGGTSEILSKTGGLLFETKEQMVMNMECVARYDEQRYRSIAMSAQKVAQDNYSIESNVELTYQFYLKILKSRGG